MLSNFYHQIIGICLFPELKLILDLVFSVAAPSLWNTPPDNVKSTNTVISASNGMTFHHQPDLPTVMDSPYLLRFGCSKYGVTALLQIIRQRAVAVNKSSKMCVKTLFVTVTILSPNVLLNDSCFKIIVDTRKITENFHMTKVT